MTIKKALMAMLSLSLLAGCASQTAQSEAEETADAMEDKADQILEDAKAEAEKIKEDAEKEAEKIKEDAKAEADKIKEDVDGEEDKTGDSSDSKADSPQPVGTTLEKDGLAYTFESVEYTEGTEIFKPTEGNNFVNCLVKIENKTNEAVEYNAYSCWEMISPTGAYENITVAGLSDDKKTLSVDKIAPGGYVEGYVSFDEPKEGKLILVVNTDEYPREEVGQWLVRE